MKAEERETLIISILTKSPSDAFTSAEIARLTREDKRYVKNALRQLVRKERVNKVWISRSQVYFHVKINESTRPKEYHEVTENVNNTNEKEEE